MTSLSQPWTTTKRNPVLIPAFSAPGGVARFDSFIRSADRLVTQLAPSHALILCAILYEGMGSSAELSNFLHALVSSHSTCDGHYVQWSDEQDRLHSRALDPRTRIALFRVPSGTLPKKDLDSFHQVLLKNYPMAQSQMGKDLWHLIFHDALAWLHQHIPNFCLGMLTGSIPITALPRDVLTRWNLRQKDVHWETRDAADDDALSPSHDGALEILLEMEAPINRRARCLKEIQDLFTLPNQATDIRLSDQRWRTSLYSRLAMTADLIARQGTEGDALVLLWVHHLLSVGSVRLKNPSVATISRYVSAAAGLISENYTQCPCSAVHMDDEQWIAFFDALKHAVNSDPQRPALASFHQFCIQTFGAPPMAQVLFSGDGNTTVVHANTVWSQEIHGALELALTASSDARICASVQALLALAAIFPLRIGEAQALRLEDFVITEEGIELRYHPRRGQHQGKSYSAKRWMRSFGEPAWVACVASWIKRRKSEEEGRHGKSALLFGDPHSSHRTYMFAACSRLVNRALKQVCGDKSVSFHTLRHAWVNRNIIHQLDQPSSRPSPVSWLQKVAAEVGHAQVPTTLQHYFHRPDMALRCSLNSYWQTRPLTAEVAAFWTGRSAAALRKAKQRSENKAEFLWSCLFETSTGLAVRQAPPPSLLAALPPPPIASIGLMHVRKILCDLHTGIPVEAVASRCSVPLATVLEVIDRAVLIANQLLVLGSVRGRRLILEHATRVIKLARLLQIFMDCDIRPTVTDEPSWQKLAPQNIAPTFAQRNAVRSWMHCRDGQSIALRPDGSADDLLRWLSDGSVPGSCIVLRVPMKHVADPHSRATTVSSDSARSAQDQLGQYFGTSVTIEGVRQRKLEQPPYMLISRKPFTKTSKPCPSARLRMGSFHGLMFSMAVWHGMIGMDAHE